MNDDMDGLEGRSGRVCPLFCFMLEIKLLMLSSLVQEKRV